MPVGGCRNHPACCWAKATITGRSRYSGHMIRATEAVAEAGQKRVYILARKRLVLNTRIFKQATTLANHGYEVVLIGLRGVADSSGEDRGDYRIVRLSLTPPHVKALQAVRRARATMLRAVRRLRGSVWRAGRRCGRFGLSVGRRVVGALPRSRSDRRGLRDPLAKGESRLRRWFKRIPTAIGAALGGGRSASITHRFMVRPVGALWILPKKGTMKAIQGAERVILRHVQWPSRSWAYYRAVYRLFQDPGLPAPTVIQANDLDTLLVAVLIARRRGLPVVYDAQELYTGIHTLPRWYTWLLSAQEFVLLRFVDRVVVVNDAIGDVMERRYRRPIDAVVLNCPPYQHISGRPAQPNLKERTGLAGDLKVLVYSGGLSPNRGIENVVLALPELHDCALVVLGEGVLQARLQEVSEAAGVSSRVRYLAPVPHEEVPMVLSSADLGVIPYENVGLNHYLCSPSKLFHYMMAGLPVACSDFPFLRRVVLDNRIGCVFDPSSPNSIAHAIGTFLGNPNGDDEARQRLVLAKGSYSWETHGKRFLDIYRTL